MTALVAGVFSPAASARTEDSPRRDYLSAMEAARNGNLARAKQFLPRLDGYVLRGYVEYELLKDRLALTPPDRIRCFLEENRDAPISDIIRKKWLRQLASKGEWEAFLREYQDVENDPELQCQRLTQLLRPERATPPGAADGRDRETLAHRQTAARGVRCGVRGVEKSGHMTSEKVWERIRLAMENGQLGLAGDLARYLDYSERAWVTRWQAMHRDPPRELDRLHYPVETPVARGIVRHGIVRMARRDPEAAMQQWQKLKSRHRFLGEDENYVLRHLGIAAAQNHLPVALTWLANVSADASDETLHLWRVRAALRAGDWEAARGFVAGLTEGATAPAAVALLERACSRPPATRATTPGMEEVEQRREQLPRHSGCTPNLRAAAVTTVSSPPTGWARTTRCSTLPSTLTRRSFRFCSCARACRWRRNCTPSARPWTRAGSGTGARATSATANCRWQR